MPTRGRRSFVPLGLLVIAACGRSDSGPPGPGIGPPAVTSGEGTCALNACMCPTKTSCRADCGSATSCNVDCHDAVTCETACRDNCRVDCHGAQSSCIVTAGALSNVDCHGIKDGLCRAWVGNGSNVDCHGAGTCEVTCAGSCVVNCEESRCKVVCAPGATCVVGCKGGPSRCADGRTHVCGGAAC